MKAMKIPTFSQAKAYLIEAENRNPGPWVAHSVQVAEAARAITVHHSGLDGDAAYILGLLHDIGRREGVTGMRHVYDGYKFLLNEGYFDAARISLTHSFPIPNVYAGSSKWDATEDEIKEVQVFLDSHPFDDYDRLIQLCDSLALPNGFCLIEKRLMDVLMRYKNFNEYTIPQWQAILDIKGLFDSAIGQNIYSLLPGVVETTFGF